MADERIEDIKQREAKATPRPWSHIEGNLGWSPFWYTTDDDGVYATLGDAEFVVHARQDIPYLLRRLEAAEAALEVFLTWPNGAPYPASLAGHLSAWQQAKEADRG